MKSSYLGFLMIMVVKVARDVCLLASLYGIAGLDFYYTCGKLLSKHCCNRGLQRVPTPMNHERMTPNGLGIGTVVSHIARCKHGGPRKMN